MKASGCVFVSTRVPVLAQTPVTGIPEPDDPPLDDVAPELDPVATVPDELPDEPVPPELPLTEASAVSAGVDPVEQALLSQKLAAKKETNAAVSAILKLKCRMFFPAPVLRRHPTNAQPAMRELDNARVTGSVRKPMARKRPGQKKSWSRTRVYRSICRSLAIFTRFRTMTQEDDAESQKPGRGETVPEPRD
jgi:hypothetical protein